jgi:hypothetical protein
VPDLVSIDREGRVMARGALGVIVGLIVWVGIATAAGVVMRQAWPAYASVADAMTFTLPMMIARLAIGAVATLIMGFVAAAVARQSVLTSLLPGVLLLAAFIPEHVMIWEKFPVWYHLTFLLSLVPLTFLGGKISASRGVPEGRPDTPGLTRVTLS